MNINLINDLKAISAKYQNSSSESNLLAVTVIQTLTGTLYENDQSINQLADLVEIFTRKKIVEITSRNN